MSSSSSSSDGVLDDMVIAMAQEAMDYLQEAESSASRTRQPPIERNRLAAHERLVQDYFCETPVYDDDQFKRRFRMNRRLFVKISNDLGGESPFFTQRVSASGKVGFSGLQKCTATIRQLAYGTSIDAWDEYLRMSSRMCRESLENFCEGVISLYGRRYLRMPTAADVPILYEAHQRLHGFPGMLGSLDCMHWEWATCPTAWKWQQHHGDHDGPTVILQAVASQDLWIWHAYFGMADGIYPEWATLVKSLSCPDDEKRLYFKKKQESARKDIEWAFEHFVEKAMMKVSNRQTQAEKEDIRAKIRARHIHQNLRADLTEQLWFYREQGGLDTDDE
ncbi:uncharacterized protein LOC110893545 [Helianthus annuus]|uniref:uncharacterized protein LOC110893545 n=1 Tax=Helianthus annuus TaxID=4232 RepID=UPI001652E507|nr:uncharacterized protein LOC110893545 [Helianthus annuus]